MRNKETVLNTLNRMEDKLEHRLEMIEKRLSDLEQSRSYTKGVIAVLGAALGTAVTLLIKFIG